MKKQHLSYLVITVSALILLFSASCSQPTSGSGVTLDTWLDRVEIQEPFTFDSDVTRSARFNYAPGEFDSTDPLIDPFTDIIAENILLNLTIAAEIVEITKTVLSELQPETGDIFSLNKEIPVPAYSFSIWLYESKAIYDENNFALFITYGFTETPTEPRDPVNGPYWSSISVDQEENGSFTTVIVSDQGDDNGQNYFSYNSESGILITKSESMADPPTDTRIRHSYDVYTPTDKASGYGSQCSVDIDSDEFKIIKYSSEGGFIFEAEGTDGSTTQTLFWDPVDGYDGVYPGTNTALNEVIASWVTEETKTNATNLYIQDMLFDIDGPELSDLF